MEEILITHGMIFDGTVKVGQKVKTVTGRNGIPGGGSARYGVIAAMNLDSDGTDGPFFSVTYFENGQEGPVLPLTDLCTSGFRDTVEEELKSYQRVYLVSVDEPTAVIIEDVTEPLYILIDTNEGRVVRDGVPESDINAYVLREYRRAGTIDHLIVAPDTAFTKVGLKVTM